MYFKTLFKDYYYYNRSERNGSIFLVILSLLFFFIPSLSTLSPTNDEVSFKETLPNIEYLFVKEAKESISLVNFSINEITVNELEAMGLSFKVAKNIINYRSKIGGFKQKEDLKKVYTLSEKDYKRLENYIIITDLPSKIITKKVIKKKEQKTTLSIKKDLPILSSFDPNTASKTELLQLGLNKRVVNNIINYRNKGGYFYKAESLKKIYGLEETMYNKLAPYIVINTTNKVDSDSIQSRQKRVQNFANIVIDINQATAEEWQQLHGIGPYFSKKIINFRKYLGGFSTIEQVAETYGLKPETFEQIKPYLKLSPVIKKININEIEAKELSKHPYLSWQESLAIYNYRQQHGAYTSKEDLKKVLLLKPEVIEKITPYLDFM